MGFIIESSEGNFYYSGDTALTYDMKLIGEFYGPELAFLPIGDHFTMDPRQGAYAARLLNVKRVIPMHYGTFPALTGTPEKLRPLLPRGVQLVALKPGETTD